MPSGAVASASAEPRSWNVCRGSWPPDVALWLLAFELCALVSVASALACTPPWRSRAVCRKDWPACCCCCCACALWRPMPGEAGGCSERGPASAAAEECGPGWGEWCRLLCSSGGLSRPRLRCRAGCHVLVGPTELGAAASPGRPPCSAALCVRSGALSACVRCTWSRSMGNVTGARGKELCTSPAVISLLPQTPRKLCKVRSGLCQLTHEHGVKPQRLSSAHLLLRTQLCQT